MVDGVELDEIRFERAGRTVLDGVTATLSEHRVGLIGRNGSGKTTLLRLIGALDYATSGYVRIAGIDPRENLKKVRPLVGYLFQNPETQLVLPRVAEDVALGLTRGTATDDQRALVAEALAQFGVGHLAERFTHQLSGGEQQLVALAGVVVRKPRLLLLDEPTTHLDLTYSGRMRAAIDSLEQQAIIASHDLELIASCDRVLVIDGGRVDFDGAAGPAIDRYREIAQWS
ncbi:MAG: ABC transporter ATP-binding protein [Baekduia sp.]